MEQLIPVITVDGPGGSGKGSLCQDLKSILKWNSLDSGIIYRAFAFAVLQSKIDIKSESKLLEEISSLDLSFFPNNIRNDESCVLMKGREITNEIRDPMVGTIASYIATVPRLRESILQYQRSFRKKPGLIADGRDMGTIVFPNACIKIFLDASIEERARRRMLQLRDQGFNVNFDEVLAEINGRDTRDRSRSNAPLVPASDSVIIDSTNLSRDQVNDIALGYARDRLKP
jgi:cytidylate kinase